MNYEEMKNWHVKVEREEKKRLKQGNL